MGKLSVKKIHSISKWITAVLILVMAVGLIISCLNIYESGQRPFSREAIAAALRQLAVPGYLCLIAVIATAFLHILLPLDPEKKKPVLEADGLLRRYSGKFSDLNADEQTKISQEMRWRRICSVSTTMVCIALAVYPVIYYADPSHFSVTDLTGDIIRAVLVALVPTAAALVLLYLSGLVREKSIKREIAIYKAHPVKPERIKNVPDRSNLTAIRTALIAVAMVLIILGIFNDGVADVLGKAIRICTECIGLG